MKKNNFHLIEVITNLVVLRSMNNLTVIVLLTIRYNCNFITSNIHIVINIFATTLLINVNFNIPTYFM